MLFGATMRKKTSQPRQHAGVASAVITHSSSTGDGKTAPAASRTAGAAARRWLYLRHGTFVAAKVGWGTLCRQDNRRGRVSVVWLLLLVLLIMVAGIALFSCQQGPLTRTEVIYCPGQLSQVVAALADTPAAPLVRGWREAPPATGRTSNTALADECRQLLRQLAAADDWQPVSDQAQRQTYISASQRAVEQLLPWYYQTRFSPLNWRLAATDAYLVVSSSVSLADGVRGSRQVNFLLVYRQGSSTPAYLLWGDCPR